MSEEMIVTEEIKSSGEMREFNTGSHRDASSGKGRMDLLPASSVIKVYRTVLPLETSTIDPKDYLENALVAVLMYIDGNRNEDYLSIAARSALIATGIEETLSGGDKDGNKVGKLLDTRECLAFGLKQTSIHYENGAAKYGENNWKLGQPVSVLLDSAMRHLTKAISDITDEPHCRAASWNLLCAIWTDENLPEMRLATN